MIPEDKIAAVKKALKISFGVDEVEDIKQLTSGLSRTIQAIIFADADPDSYRDSKASNTYNT